MLAYWWISRHPSIGTGGESSVTSGGALVVQVFFGNSEKDPQALDCSRVYPVERRIPPTDAVARAAIEELLAGPTPEERRQGYFTSLKQGVPIRKLEIENGTAWIDFGRAFEEGVAGSCRVEAVRAQVERTLLQFPSVHSVRITVEGREATALQP